MSMHQTHTLQPYLSLSLSKTQPESLHFSYCEMRFLGAKSLIALLFSFLLCFSLAISLHGDAETLIRVKSDQLDDPNRKLGDWVRTSQQSPCNWTGITCETQNQSVVGIDLSGFDLSGGFPNGFCRIRTLRNLNLSDNYFNGTLSSQSLSPCFHLQVLALDYNVFIGELPDFSREFANLQVLDRSYFTFLQFFC